MAKLRFTRRKGAKSQKATKSKVTKSKPTCNQPTFPLLRLPFELQSIIFTMALEEAYLPPGIQWVNMKIAWSDRQKTSWGITLVPLAKDSDDSKYRKVSDLAGICDAAADAALLFGRDLSKATIGSQDQIIDGKRDIVCVKAPRLVGLPAKRWDDYSVTNKDRVFWHQDSQRDSDGELRGLAEMSYDSVQAAMRGFEKIGITYRNALDNVSEPFLCADDSVQSVQTSHTYLHHVTGRKLEMCQEELAGFIDCCPDIREFFLILPIRAVCGKARADAFQQWESDRSKNPLGSLDTYHGRQLAYREVHVGQLETDFRRRPVVCTCVDAPACHEQAPGVNSDDAFDLIQKTRQFLISPRANFRLSYQQRLDITFKVLVQGMPPGSSA